MKTIKFLYISLTLFFLGCSQQINYIGDVINYSRYTVQVTDISTLPQIFYKNPIGGSNVIDLVAPSGKVFVVVKYDIKNTTSSNLSYLDFPDIKLIDADSNELVPDSEATMTYMLSNEMKSILNSNDSELTSEDYASAKKMEEELDIKKMEEAVDIKPNVKSPRVQVFVVSKDKFNESWKIKVGDTLVSLKSKRVDGKSKTEVSSNTAPAKVTSWEDCYSAAYKEISDATAEDLIKEGTYKTKDEIPEQELVPQGVRMGLEEDCKEKSKGK
jgi:hypothetical protein